MLCGVVGELGAVVFDEAFKDGAEPEIPVAVFERGSGVLGELVGWLVGFGLLCDGWLMEGGDQEHEKDDSCGGGSLHGVIACFYLLHGVRRLHRW